MQIGDSIKQDYCIFENNIHNTSFAVLTDIQRRALNGIHFGEVEGESRVLGRQRGHFSLLVITPTENLRCEKFYDLSSMNVTNYLKEGDEDEYCFC